LGFFRLSTEISYPNETNSLLWLLALTKPDIEIGRDGKAAREVLPAASYLSNETFSALRHVLQNYLQKSATESPIHSQLPHPVSFLTQKRKKKKRGCRSSEHSWLVLGLPRRRAASSPPPKLLPAARTPPHRLPDRLHPPRPIPAVPDRRASGSPDLRCQPHLHRLIFTIELCAAKSPVTGR
jgi:hypothetical protein